MDGIIAWYDTAKGYGFITPDDGADDIFFDRAAVEPSTAGDADPRPGESVTFEVVDGTRGPQAARVVRNPG